MMDSDYPPEAEQYFQTRTEKHIALVKHNLSLWAKKYPELANELYQRGETHDKSKFVDPERTPYIWRSWLVYCTLNNIPFKCPEGMSAKINYAMSHHSHHNRHHPEYHLDLESMSQIDLIEMICDWKANSQEFGEKSPMNFANAVLGKHFHFNPTKCDQIRSLIIDMDNMTEQTDVI